MENVLLEDPVTRVILGNQSYLTQILTPKSLQENLLSLVYHLSISGYMGVGRMYHSLR